MVIFMTFKKASLLFIAFGFQAIAAAGDAVYENCVPDGFSFYENCPRRNPKSDSSVYDTLEPDDKCGLPPSVSVWDEETYELCNKKPLGRGFKKPKAIYLPPIDPDFLKITWDGDITKVKAALAKGANVNTLDRDKNTPLIVASFRGRSDLVELFLRNGAEVNSQNNVGWTALMCAARKKRHLKIVL